MPSSDITPPWLVTWPTSRTSARLQCGGTNLRRPSRAKCAAPGALVRGEAPVPLGALQRRKLILPLLTVVLGELLSEPFFKIFPRQLLSAQAESQGQPQHQRTERKRECHNYRAGSDADLLKCHRDNEENDHRPDCPADEA